MDRRPSYGFSGYSEEVAKPAIEYADAAGISLGEATEIVLARHVLQELAPHLSEEALAAIRSRWIDGVRVEAMPELHKQAWKAAREAEREGDYGVVFLVGRLSAGALRNDVTQDVEDNVDLLWQAAASFIHDFRESTGLPTNSIPRGANEGLLARHRTAPNT